MNIEDRVKDMTLDQLREEIVKIDRVLQMMGKITHDHVTANQAAWIEWQHGRGADAAMGWIHSGLWGPGLIPDEDEPYGKEAQAYFDANRAQPFPACACGRPSNQLWMGHGACSDPCMIAARETHAHGESA
ncbi:hypothetical protein ABRP17_016495 [Stenotrophomonas sp. WHRI 8082]|uniref:hypothetical protein n=1 Tax=Stenotrophomonas sp. WHRI 8082 TaxID=3162571 RepID=UPI0032EEB805